MQHLAKEREVRCVCMTTSAHPQDVSVSDIAYSGPSLSTTLLHATSISRRAKAYFLTRSNMIRDQATRYQFGDYLTSNGTRASVNLVGTRRERSWVKVPSRNSLEASETVEASSRLTVPASLVQPSHLPNTRQNPPLDPP
jgi:hypothetical protein